MGKMIGCALERCLISMAIEVTSMQLANIVSQAFLPIFEPAKQHIRCFVLKPIPSAHAIFQTYPQLRVDLCRVLCH